MGWFPQRNEWVQQACGKIRFAPDREKVYDELMGHMEDMYQNYLDAGLPPEQAVERVLERMGDAQAVALQLQQVHRPFWAYLAKYTQILGHIAKAYLVFYLVMTVWTLAFTPDYDPDDYFSHHDGVDILSDYTPSTVVKSQGYTISVERIRFVQSNDSGRADFVLKVTHLNPWLQNPYFYRNLSATDDCGNIYLPRWAITNTSQPEVTGNTAYSNAFVTYHEMWMEPIDLDATTITLHFDDYGVAWDIPLVIEGGVSYE